MSSRKSSMPSGEKTTSKRPIRPRRWYFELQGDDLIEVRGPSVRLDSGGDNNVVRVKKERGSTQVSQIAHFVDTPHHPLTLKVQADASVSIESSPAASSGRTDQVSCFSKQWFSIVRSMLMENLSYIALFFSE